MQLLLDDSTGENVQPSKRKEIIKKSHENRFSFVKWTNTRKYLGSKIFYWSQISATSCRVEKSVIAMNEEGKTGERREQQMTGRNCWETHPVNLNRLSRTSQFPLVYRFPMRWNRINFHYLHTKIQPSVVVNPAKCWFWIEHSIFKRPLEVHLRWYRNNISSSSVAQGNLINTPDRRTKIYKLHATPLCISGFHEAPFNYELGEKTSSTS